LDKQSTWEALQHVPPHWRVQLRSMLQALKESTDA
ncbi:MAG TPA: dTDP-4-dehydrorhamnose reductase, partial [Halieaceae bacterium]|nr:dTDP-4-dehydrorhamnose reductase [Halieaceae bacterium]